MAPCSLPVSDQPAFWHLDAARGPSTPSFDHLVGAGEQRQRDRQAERLRGLHVDDQLDLHRLLHWQIGWLFALENAARVDADKAVHIDKVGAVTHQAAKRGVFAKWIARRNRIPCRQRGELFAVAGEEWVGRDEERTGMP